MLKSASSFPADFDGENTSVTLPVFGRNGLRPSVCRRSSVSLTRFEPRSPAGGGQIDKNCSHSTAQSRSGPDADEARARAAHYRQLPEIADAPRRLSARGYGLAEHRRAARPTTPGRGQTRTSSRSRGAGLPAPLHFKAASVCCSECVDRAAEEMGIPRATSARGSTQPMRTPYAAPANRLMTAYLGSLGPAERRCPVLAP